jgi:hypothetical protein
LADAQVLVSRTTVALRGCIESLRDCTTDPLHEDANSDGRRDENTLPHTADILRDHPPSESVVVDRE